MSLLIERKKSIQILQEIVLDQQIIVDETKFKTINISVDVIPFNHSTHGLDQSYDLSKSRKHFWEKIFGLAPLPIEESNVAERYSGSLGTDLGITESDIQSAIEDADKD